MSLHADLFKQAKGLARKEPRCPCQASPRRAISASYYAFHCLIVDDSARLMLSGQVVGTVNFDLRTQ